MSSSPTDNPALWTVPYRRNLYFTGRDELITLLDQHLSGARSGEVTTTHRAALTQPQAIKGLGGIGKTQIAVEYAYRAREQEQYIHTFWINAASQEALMSSFTQLAEMLPAFAAKDETHQHKLVVAIKRWLEQCQERWLLIFDNADDLSLVHDYIPHAGNGSILLTTRANAVGSLAMSIEVETMSFVEGTHLLLRRAQRFLQASDEEVNEAGNIVVALDHFPLALEQAGAYIEETGCSLQNYLQLYQTHRKILLARRGAQTTNYPDSVATTWSLSFQKVEQAHSAAAELLSLCAFLAPDHIPEELLTEGASHWPPMLQQAATDPFAFDQMLEALLAFSLIKRLTENHLLSIHRLVQAVQLDRMGSEEQHQWAERMIRAVNAVFPRHPKEDVTSWPQCLRYLEQVQACNTLIQKQRLMFPEGADLLDRSGTYLREHASYTLAEALYQQALSIREQYLGSHHPDMAENMNNLSILYRRQGKYEQAEALSVRALSIREKHFGSHHPTNVKIISAPSSPEETIPTSTQEESRESKQDITSFSGTTNTQKMHTNVRLSRQDRQNREYMLKQMHSVWIEGVFENSLYQTILIELGLSATPQAVTNPWKLEVQETDLPAHPLPSGTRITTVYDSADGKFLILGEPGAGKTTLLLELARDLIKRAEADEQVRIPVVFPLASWAMKRESLSTWLIEELQTKYYLSHHLAQKWIKNGQIIPLLDGLDEVALEYRRMCLDVINTYHKEHYLDPLVICSRRKEYDALKTPLVIRQAVMIQPLQREQIDAYFERIGEPVASLRQTIQKNTDLQELATTPLLLSLLTLAYQGTTAYDLRDQRSVEALRRHIFERYVERMLTRRGKTTSYTNEQIRHWLTWLASHMKQQHLTTFYLERMQLDWLPGKWWRLVNRFVIGLLFGIGSGLPFGLSFGLAGEMAGGLPLGLLFGLLFGLLGGLRKIRPAETIHWSWNTLKRRLYIVALFGLSGGLLCGGSNSTFGNLLSGLLFGLLGGLLFGLLGALFAGISQGTMNAQFLLTPNYGMQRSVKNSLYVGILSLVATELVAVLFVVLTSGLGSIVMDEILIWLFNALFVGLFIGLFVGLLYGGTAPFQQKLLLLSLYRLGSLPKNTIAFLEYANERILLHRVGGGYMFPHQLLLDYFATQEQPHTPEQK